jgi:hypothetical protein
MDHPHRRRPATSPEAVHRFDILSSDRPEYGLRLTQQLEALRVLLLFVCETGR